MVAGQFHNPMVHSESVGAEQQPLTASVSYESDFFWCESVSRNRPRRRVLGTDVVVG
jgi:hypothetical protein